MNEFQLCIKCQTSFHQDLNQHGLCPICQQKVIEYFNKYIVSSEIVTERSECTIKNLDFNVEYGDTVETIATDDQQEFYDDRTGDVLTATDPEEVIDYIIQKI